MISVFRKCLIGFVVFVLLALLPTASVLAGQAVLSWFPSTEPDLAGYVLYYKDDSNSLPLTKTQFTQKISLFANDTTYTQLGLGEGTHRFALTAFDTSSNESRLSVVVQKTISSSDPPLPEELGAFTATSGEGNVFLSWNNPSDSNFERVQIRYRTDRFPEDMNDGDLVADLSGEPSESMDFAHSGLENGLTYYYRAIPFDQAGNAQTAGFAKATPGLPSEEETSGGGGGCGMIYPDSGGKPPKPGDAAGMLLLFAGGFVLLIKKILQEKPLTSSI